MKNEELYTYIENYLAGELDEQARAEFEQRRLDDPEFAAEVALHQRLQKEFQDSKKLELRGILDDLSNEFSGAEHSGSDETPPASGSGKFWTWIILGLALVLAIFNLWYFTGTDDSSNLSETTPAQEEQTEVVDTPATTEAPTASEPEPTPPATEAIPPTAEAPTLRINPALEALIGQSSSTDEYEFQVDTPTSDATFTTENGQISFQLSGIMLTSEFPENDRFLVQIYSNDPAAFEQKQPESQFPLRFPEQEEDEDIEFAFGEKEEFPFTLPVETLELPLTPGLYYYTIVQESTGNIWYTGKFRVE